MQQAAPPERETNERPLSRRAWIFGLIAAGLALVINLSQREVLPSVLTESEGERRPRSAGRRKTLLTLRILDRLNAEPGKALFPQGASR